MTDRIQCSYCGTWRHKSVAKCLTCGKARVVPYWIASWGLGLAVGLIIAGVLK